MPEEAEKKRTDGSRRNHSDAGQSHAGLFRRKRPGALRQRRHRESLCLPAAHEKHDGGKRQHEQNEPAEDARIDPSYDGNADQNAEHGAGNGPCGIMQHLRRIKTVPPLQHHEKQHGHRRHGAQHGTPCAYGRTPPARQEKAEAWPTQQKRSASQAPSPE